MFWQTHPSLWWEVHAIVFEVEQLREAIEDLSPDISHFKSLNVN